MRIFLIGVASLLFVACTDQTHATQSQRDNRPSADVQEGTLAAAAVLPNVYPVANGCSYVRGVGDPALWFVCGNKASRVTGASLEDVGKISPLADGGAITTGDDGSNLIYLIESHAIVVTEGNATPPKTMPNSAAFNFARAASLANQADAD